MNELIDKNKDENGKIIFRFSREPITKKEKDLFEPNSESYAMKELENLKIRAKACTLSNTMQKQKYLIFIS